MTLIERYKTAMNDLQKRKDVLFTDEIRKTKTYSDMHVNKEALDPEQSKFLKIVENSTMIASVLRTKNITTTKQLSMQKSGSLRTYLML